jgi:hypothetical protein
MSSVANCTWKKPTHSLSVCGFFVCVTVHGVLPTQAIPLVAIPPSHPLVPVDPSAGFNHATAQPAIPFPAPAPPLFVLLTDAQPVPQLVPAFNEPAAAHVPPVTQEALPPLCLIVPLFVSVHFTKILYPFDVNTIELFTVRLL